MQNDSPIKKKAANEIPRRIKMKKKKEQSARERELIEKMILSLKKKKKKNTVQLMGRNMQLSAERRRILRWRKRRKHSRSATVIHPSV